MADPCNFAATTIDSRFLHFPACLSPFPPVGSRDACWSSSLVANRASGGGKIYRVNDSNNRQRGHTEATSNIPGATAEVRCDERFGQTPR